MQYPVIIFSETDDAQDRERVKQAVIRHHNHTPLDYILAIDIGSHQVQPNQTTDWQTNPARYRHSPRTYELGQQLGVPVIGIDTWEKRVYLRDRIRDGQVVHQGASLLLRETRMVENILKYGALGHCAVIVGDVNLRGLPTEAYGETSLLVKKLLCQENVTFVPTPLSDRMQIVKVSGNSFNQHIYQCISQLHHEMLDETEGDFQSPEGLLHMYRIQREAMKNNLRHLSQDDTWLCVIDGHLVSLVSVSPGVNQMLALTMAYTRPAYRENGYMSSILRRVMQYYCKDKHRLYLNALVTNDTAIRLYHKFGFRPVYCTMMKTD